jgi:hypothetical protein
MRRGLGVYKRWMIGGVILAVVLTGVVLFTSCNNSEEPVSQTTTAASPTAISVVNTLVSLTPLSSMTSDSTQVGETITSTPLPPTAFPTSQEMQSPLPPTATTAPAVAANSPIPTSSLPCNQASPGEPLDVTIPDGTRFAPGDEFIKTWRITNTGSCTWTTQYALVWVSGEQMSASTEVGWDFNVAPGELLEISVLMKAPGTPGSYQSGWQLRSPSGERFGIGAGGGTALEAQVEVAAAATATPTPTTGSISGRVILNGAPIGGVNLTLEDRGYMTIASAQTGPDGSYSLSNLPAYQDGYNLVFNQEANPQFNLDQVVSWSWIGPIPTGGGTNVALPDFEIGLAGLSLINPAADSSYSVLTISPGSPLLFDFSPYAGAASYWVDISQGEEQTWVWQSGLVAGPPVAFEGMLFGGAPLQPGDYWWAVGAQKPLGSYTQTVYSYLVGFGVEP